MMQKSQRKNFQYAMGSHRFDFGKRTYLMGIINATPDSFSQDGFLKNQKRQMPGIASKIVSRARAMIREGADIIDIGGESTRPGSQKISEEEEIQRVVPSIKMLSQRLNVPISIDSYKSRVIEEALAAGATIVNNIKGVNPSKKILHLVKKFNATIILMHMRKTPAHMQKNIHYEKDIISVIIGSLQKSIEKCLEAGIKSDKIIIDPGIGFGKTVEHNLEIINRLNRLNILKKPLCVGSSRKSFIGKILNKDVGHRLFGTMASVCTSILHGAHIVRVHDVKAAKETAVLTDAILNESY